MLVFVTCVKHPDNSQSYQKVWRMLNNTLYSICSQQDTEFRSIVVCDKKLPLFHHQSLINTYTEFIEVNFPPHGQDVLDDFNRLGNLSPPLEDSEWWVRWKGQKDFKIDNASEYFHIANVVLNMGSKLIAGMLAAKKHNPDYVMFVDADDFIGRDVAAYVNSHPGENGWIMSHGYKMAGNQMVPVYNRNSVCGTGNIYNYALMLAYIGAGVTEKSTQSKLFAHVNSEYLITIGKHQKTRSYFQEKGRPLLDYPSRSVVYSLWHDESSEYIRKAMRGEADLRLKNSRKCGPISPVNSAFVHYFNILPSHSGKVFYSGFFQPASTQLVRKELQAMGYQVASRYKNWDVEFYKTIESGDLSELQQVSELFDAFEGVPWFLFYQDFDRCYPGSKFILLQSDSCSWWERFSNCFEKRNLPIIKMVFGVDNPVGNEKIFVDRFEEHQHQVIDYFKHRPDDLLVVPVGDYGALKEIRNFLWKSPVDTNSLHKNSQRQARQANRKTPHRRQLKKFTWQIKRRLKQKSMAATLKMLAFPTPVIISGGRESGAELMLAILSCHPHLHTVNSVIFKTSRQPLLSPGGSVQSYRSSSQVGSPIDSRQLMLDLFDIKRPVPPSARRWCSTSPQGILIYEQLLAHYGSKVRILNMVRDGRGVVTEYDPMVMADYAVDCERWVHAVKAGMKYENHPQCLTVRYEDLLHDYESTVRQVSEFIGEQDATPLLNYPQGAKRIVDWYWAEKWQQPQYADRVSQLLQTPGALECLQHYGYTV